MEPAKEKCCICGKTDPCGTHESHKRGFIRKPEGLFCRQHYVNNWLRDPKRNKKRKRVKKTTSTTSTTTISSSSSSICSTTSKSNKKTVASTTTTTRTTKTKHKTDIIEFITIDDEPVPPLLYQCSLCDDIVPVKEERVTCVGTIFLCFHFDTIS